MVSDLHIDSTLIGRYLDEMAQVGKVGETGVWRTVYTPEWQAAQDLYTSWCRDAGLTVRRDAVGNVWGVLEGRQGGKSIISGSHIDSQKPGGRFDGTLGVIAALIAVRALKEQCGEPRRTVESVSLCEEESSRFPGANFWASRAITAQIDPSESDTLVDDTGTTMGEAMRSVGLDPKRLTEAARDDIDAFLELHIEQGPVLEEENLAVGVVTGITGLRHVVVEVTGRADHAGASPMDLRRDAMPVAAEIITNVIDVARRLGRPAVTTVGRVVVEPNFSTAVPERVTFTIDARHPDPDMRREMYRQQDAILTEAAARAPVRVQWHTVLQQPPVPCDSGLVQLLTETARDLGIPVQRLPSGAGHDSQVLSRVARVGMIFVRSKDGRSHAPEEFTTLDDIVLGTRVLAETLHALAY